MNKYDSLKGLFISEMQMVF